MAERAFKLGRTVMTNAITRLIEEDELFSKEVMSALKRYQRCDWGDTCEGDKLRNENALAADERILSVYDTLRGKIWIITEWDRSYTTILFPNEY